MSKIRVHQWSFAFPKRGGSLPLGLNVAASAAYLCIQQKRNG